MQAMEVTEIHPRLELVHLSAQVFGAMAALLPCIEQPVDFCEIRRQVRVLDAEIHLGREVERSYMELIDEEIVKRRRDMAALVPRKIGVHLAG